MSSLEGKASRRWWSGGGLARLSSMMTLWCLGQHALAAEPSVLGAAASYGRLNDSGVTRCVDANTGAKAGCAGTGQDGELGRDVSVPKPGDGHKGFSFIKVGADGTYLSRKATAWSCVVDTVTGLMWESKTTDGGPHDVSMRYRNQENLAAGDASVFVQLANAERWCGQSDWRLPTMYELVGLTDFGLMDPALQIRGIDAAFFPVSDESAHWSQTSVPGFPDQAWSHAFPAALTVAYLRDSLHAVRLVRSLP